MNGLPEFHRLAEHELHEAGRYYDLEEPWLGIARIRLRDGTLHEAEVHWYEAHGIGRHELKIKSPLLD